MESVSLISFHGTIFVSGWRRERKLQSILRGEENPFVKLTRSWRYYFLFSWYFLPIILNLMCSKVLSLNFNLKESSLRLLRLHLLQDRILMSDLVVCKCRLSDIHKTARSNVCFCSCHDRSRQVKDVAHFQRLQVLGDSALQAVQLAVWECAVSKLAHLGLHTLRYLESLKRVSYQAKRPHSAMVVQDGAAILNARFYHPVIDVPNWRPARLIGELRASQGKKITWWGNRNHGQTELWCHFAIPHFLLVWTLSFRRSCSRSER